MKIVQLFFGTVGSVALFFFGAAALYAEVDSANFDSVPFFIRLDAVTISKGYTVTAFDESLKLSLVPGILSEATNVSIEEVLDMDMPWQLERISPIYQFEFLNKSAYDDSNPFYIQFQTTQQSANYKQVFFYDKNFNTWRPLPTEDFSEGSFVRSLIHLPYARIAVFAYPDILASGEASWYAHKKGMYAASTDFPRGSRLRVRNNENGKHIDVIVNDYGPDRSRFPNRVIDLEKEAYARIAPLGSGVTSVSIEPLHIAGTGSFGIPPKGAGIEPIIASKSAIVVNEQSGKTVFEKNADEVLPIASLTKLVAIRVFLDAHPKLEDVVAYRVSDEQYNYQYVDRPSEIALLRVKDGETMTVEDLVYSALVGSANNAVESLVRVSGMSRDAFILEMNMFAKKLNLSSVHFEDPAGLSPANVSSARDYIKLARETLSHPTIEKASITKQYVFSTLNTGEKHTIKNSNRLLAAGLAVTGSKTGYLNEAGYCLITRIKTAEGSFIALALGDTSKDSNTAYIRELLRFGEYKSRSVRVAALKSVSLAQR